MAGAPADGCGVPFAMWMRPMTPMSRAAQPMAAREVSEFRSGCRMNRQPSSPSSSGTKNAPSPRKPLVTS